jgi:hypothetical protein
MAELINSVLRQKVNNAFGLLTLIPANCFEFLFRGCPISPSTLQFIRVGGRESFRMHECESIHFTYWTAPDFSRLFYTQGFTLR